jgi:hypothetical protein
MNLIACAVARKLTYAPEACVIWMSQIAKSPLVSLETARSGIPSSPRKAHKSPQKTEPPGSVFPQKPRRRKINPHSSKKPSG